MTSLRDVEDQLKKHFTLLMRCQWVKYMSLKESMRFDKYLNDLISISLKESNIHGGDQARKAQPITIIHLELIIPQREGKGIAAKEQAEDQRKLVKASSIVRPNPDAPVLVPYMINGKLFHLTTKQIQAHLDKEEQIKKTKKEARLLAINKPEVIKVVREEAKKLRIHPKEAINAKAGEKFKKAQDVEDEVLKKKTC
ncbi:hypothetical protein Tco_1335876 [Tanacetum coccineum]